MIHPTAIIGSGSFIGKNVAIGAYCVIEDDVVIGDNTQLRRYVELRKGTRIGSGCYIDSGVKMSGDCLIGDNVVVRYDAIIARGCVVGDGSFISPQVMTINLDINGTPIGGAHIGKNCKIGTAVVLNPGIKIADGVKIGAMALVTKDCTVVGVPYTGIPAKPNHDLVGRDS